MRSIVALLLTSTFVCAADWPHWRGPARNGISAEKISASWPGDGPKQVWKAEVGVGFSGVAVKGSIAVTIGHREEKDIVTAINADNGKTLWTFDYPAELGDKYFEGGPTSTPSIEGDRVYVLGREGQLHCLQLASGKPVWSKNIAEETSARNPDWGFSGSPLVLDDKLILNVGSAGTGVEKATGKLLWKSGDEPSAGYSTPLPLADGSVTFANTDAYFAIDPTTGSVKWQHEWNTRYGVNASDPVVIAPSKLLIASGYNKGSTLIDVSSGKPSSVWQNKNLRSQMNPPVLINGFLYGIDGDESSKPALRCVEAATGETKWTEPSIGAGTLIGVDGGKHLIVLSGKGELHLVKPSQDAFDSVASAQIQSGKCWTAPTLANGQLYLRNSEGSLIALSVDP